MIMADVTSKKIERIPLRELTIDQVADLLNVSRGTVYNYIRTGKSIGNDTKIRLPATNGKFRPTDVAKFKEAISN